jgi:signal transduction histidine kinase
MSEQSLDPKEILQRAFPGIPAKEAEGMVSIGKVESHTADVVLCQEGAEEDVFYILLEGDVKVTKAIHQNQDRLLKHLHPGDFFGEMGLIHNAPRGASVTTTMPTKVLCITKTDFENLLQRSSSVSMSMVREVSRRLRENDEMAIEDLRLKAGELASAYQRLAQEEFARREFLTSVAHELRTPLTAASGFLEMARQKMIDGDALDLAIDTVSRNVQQIVSLVNDILFLQEVELVLPEMHLISLERIVTSAVDVVQERADISRVRLQVDIPPNLPQVCGHFKSLERAVVMVLENAVKFTPHGGDIYISVDQDDEFVVVTIRDEGVGIPEVALPHIFDRFYHVEEVGEEMFGGLGLGLAITRQVIEQHGGKIEVDSKEGVGSTFRLCLSTQVECQEYLGS